METERNMNKVTRIDIDNQDVDGDGWNFRSGKKSTQELAYLVVSCHRPYKVVSFFFASTDNTKHCVFQVNEVCDTPRQNVQRRRLS